MGQIGNANIAMFFQKRIVFVGAHCIQCYGLTWQLSHFNGLQDH